MALCHVSMTFSCFLIILATIERYLITEKSKYLQQFRNKRGALAVFMFTLALVVRGSAVFEIEVSLWNFYYSFECSHLIGWVSQVTPHLMHLHSVLLCCQVMFFHIVRYAFSTLKRRTTFYESNRTRSFLSNLHMFLQLLETKKKAVTRRFWVRNFSLKKRRTAQILLYKHDCEDQ